MKRILFFLMLITGLLLIITGIGEGATREDDPMVLHILTAVIFVLLCIVHIVINRKAVMKYIRGTR